MPTEDQWFIGAGEELGEITDRLRKLCAQRPVTYRADVALIYHQLEEVLYTCATVQHSVALINDTRPPASCAAGTCRHQECARQRVAAKRAAARAATLEAIRDIDAGLAEGQLRVTFDPNRGIPREEPRV